MLICLLCVVSACNRSDESAPHGARTTADAPTSPPLPLRVLVIDDEPLGRSMARQWLSATQEAIALSHRISAELTAEPLHADVIVFPSSLLGQLVIDRQIIPWPSDLPGGEPTGTEPAGDGDYDWNDVFPLLRRHELRWGSQLYGISFGSPQLLLVYRSDLLERWLLQPPDTWEQYGQVVSAIEKQIDGGSVDAPRWATLEPMAAGWAARTLLARAAAYARHPNQYSTLFRFDSMEPLIDQPPFVRALEEMIAACRQPSTDTSNLSPDEIAARLLSGEAAIGITWPSPAHKAPEQIAAQAVFSIAPLPGAADVYQMSDKSWQTRTGGTAVTIPLLGTTGRIGAVARRARSVSAASNFLMWLTQDETARRVSSSSAATTLFRASQTASPQVWVEPLLAPAARQFAQAMVANQQQPGSLTMLRIPSQDRYLQVLDEAVRQAVAGKLSAEEALQQVARRWTQLTDQLGRDNQLAAYQASLGLDF
jgi:multiple sugar transport system substrate-binding protein